jgi:hypothetical protein
VIDHGLVCHRHQGLWPVEREGPEPRPQAGCKDHGFQNSIPFSLAKIAKNAKELYLLANEDLVSILGVLCVIILASTAQFGIAIPWP